MIILIGRVNDPHIIGICRELEKIDAHYNVLDVFMPQDTIKMHYSNGDISSYIRIHNKLIDLNSVKSIWNYSPLEIRFESSLIEESKDFVHAEWSEGVKSLWYSIDSRWVNSPSAISGSGNRIKQLVFAHQAGLDTPETIVTNDPNILVDFYHKHDSKIITKTLASSKGIPRGKFIFTNIVKDQDIRFASTLKYSPCLFQEYIPKKTELRVTIIGESIFTAEIHSQSSSKTMHDWRNYDDFKKTPYIEIALPSDISKKLIKLMRLLHLEFACMDLIVTPDEEVFFLEVNSNGRWWWIQELTGMNITKAIANYLDYV